MTSDIARYFYYENGIQHKRKSIQQVRNSVVLPHMRVYTVQCIQIGPKCHNIN